MKFKLECSDCGSIIKEVEDNSYSNDKTIIISEKCFKCRDLRKKLLFNSEKL